jgi:hypothetical protein
MPPASTTETDSRLLEFDVEHLGGDPLAEMPSSHQPLNDRCDGVIDSVALAEQPGDVCHLVIGHTGSFARGTQALEVVARCITVT